MFHHEFTRVGDPGSICFKRSPPKSSAFVPDGARSPNWWNAVSDALWSRPVRRSGRVANSDVSQTSKLKRKKLEETPGQNTRFEDVRCETDGEPQFDAFCHIMLCHVLRFQEFQQNGCSDPRQASRHP
ncbi:unnamed protein product [Prorocentrum cordatum]|uniref:Uncharacterized protein n=1 Tax=Prorocentrum cordatum TaxID=2364126 RepID=A0ABN9T2K1_9DINO|nr:unnamed protein product [Polarella glacialis]